MRAAIALPLVSAGVLARYLGAHGGRGSGKSHLFAEMVVERCVEKETHVVCIREVQKSLSQSVKKLIEIKIEEKTILKIEIPRAKREDKPIYIDNDIFEGTFKRNFEGDYKCDKESIKRMISEQVEESRDNRILNGFDFSDIDIDSLNAYRNMLSAHKPEHPYNEYDPKEFLRVIGGYGKNRETKEEGLTIAGLLMFGKLHAIREEVSNYMIDYQERPEAKTEHRWIDRITTDGTWSGNLFDFYRKVGSSILTFLLYLMKQNYFLIGILLKVVLYQKQNFLFLK